MTNPFKRDAEIFAEALRLPATERAAYLAQACGDDAELRRRVEELLDVQTRVGDFIDTPAPGADIGKIAVDTRDDATGQVGRYRLLEKLGEGGCGVVYLAQQEEPVRRQVALKIIKPGMDTREVIARFEAERQALAMMDHPGIAKVFDAGETESGRPYFVMELIRGIKITDYCDQHALPTEARLKLFVQVCQAIQHAHQKGIIHRDIKPSNILVTTTTEGTLQPVVIDFGIAKATVNVRLTDRTLFTAINMLVGTPTYMSPEQTAVSSADVDTRADIYSLGVLLYELLTGTTPFDAGELLQLGIDEVRRAIREREPPRPSSRLSKMTRQQISQVGEKRQVEPPVLIRTVSGDLDWIVMKALEKDRERRYESASGFATDLQRHIDNEPVAARPASAFYRLRKTIARNKAAFVGLGAFVSLLIAALSVVSVSLVHQRRAQEAAEKARQQADTERATAQTAELQSKQVTEFLASLFRAVDLTASKKRDISVLLEIMDKAAVQIEKELADAPRNRSRLQLIIGNIYQTLSREETVEMYKKALASSRAGWGDDAPETTAVMERLGSALSQRLRFKEAEVVLDESLAIKRRRYGEVKNAEMAITLRGLSDIYWKTERQPEAARMLREAWSVLNETKGPKDFETSQTLYALSNLHRFQGDLTEAERTQREVLAVWRETKGEHGVVCESLSTLAEILSDLGRQEEAIALADESFRLADKLFAMPHVTGARIRLLQALALLRANRFAEAETRAREAVAMAEKVHGPSSLGYYHAMAALIRILEARGQYGAAEEGVAATLKAAEQLVEAKSLDRTFLTTRLASVLTTQQRFEEADKLFFEQEDPDKKTVAFAEHLLRARSNHHARRGRWTRALADVEVLYANRPRLISNQQNLMALALINRRPERHVEVRRAMLKQYGHTTTPTRAVMVALYCTLLPFEEGLEVQALGRLADLAGQGEMGGNWREGGQLANALVEYRSGNWPSAAEWAEKATQGLRTDYRVMAHTVLAMARHGQGQTAAAESALAAAQKLARERLAEVDSADFGAEWALEIHGDLGSDWRGWIFCQTLLAEAAALIGNGGGNRE